MISLIYIIDIFLPTLIHILIYYYDVKFCGTILISTLKLVLALIMRPSLYEVSLWIAPCMAMSVCICLMSARNSGRKTL